MFSTTAATSTSTATSITTMSTSLATTTSSLAIVSSPTFITTASSFSTTPTTSVFYTISTTTPVSNEPSLKSRFKRLFSPKSTSSPELNVSPSKSSSVSPVSIASNTTDLESSVCIQSPISSQKLSPTSSTSTLSPDSEYLGPPPSPKLNEPSPEASIIPQPYTDSHADTDLPPSTSSPVADFTTVNPRENYCACVIRTFAPYNPSVSQYQTLLFNFNLL